MRNLFTYLIFGAFLIFTFERFLAKNLIQIFYILVSNFFKQLTKYANYAIIVHMCLQIKKLSHNIFHNIFHISITYRPYFINENLYSPFVILSTCCVAIVVVLHVIHTSLCWHCDTVIFHIVTFISLDVRPLRVNHLVNF